MMGWLFFFLGMFASSHASAKSSCASDAECAPDSEEAALLQFSKGEHLKTEGASDKPSPWCYTISCDEVRWRCGYKKQCCPLAGCVPSPPAPAPTALIDQVKDAFNSDAGVMVSAADSYVLQSDLSGSLMQKLLPQGLYQGPPGGSMVDNMGVIFPPAAADHPAAVCAYTCDSGTQHRENTGGDKDRCGKYPNSFNATIEDMSGACQSNGISTPQDYANYYYLVPKTTGGSGGPAISWQIQRGNCHFDTAEEALKSQLALWQEFASRISEADYDLLNQGPGNYNEIVLEASPDNENGLPPIDAYFWGHEGAFISPEDFVSLDPTRQSAICCIARQLCPSPPGPPDVPLIEIAQQTINTGWDRERTFQQLQEYSGIVDAGGYDADQIFREIPWEEVCDPAFLGTCVANPSCVQP